MRLLKVMLDLPLYFNTKSLFIGFPPVIPNGFLINPFPICILPSLVKEKSGTVKSYLKENVNHLMYSSNDKSGQFAVTHYKVLKDNGKYSMVDVCIDSGRKNQIRVHMGDLKHKVVGDEKYGPVSNPINRLGLHAYVLEFTHPHTNKKMAFKAKVPEVFNSIFPKK